MLLEFEKITKIINKMTKSQKEIKRKYTKNHGIVRWKWKKCRGKIGLCK